MRIESIIDLMTLWKESLFLRVQFWYHRVFVPQKRTVKIELWFMLLKMRHKTVDSMVHSISEVKTEMLGTYSVFWVFCFLFPTKFCKKRPHSFTFQPTIRLLLPTFLTPPTCNSGVLINQGHWQSSYLSNPIGNLFSSYLFYILILFVLLPSKLTPLWLSQCLL